MNTPSRPRLRIASRRGYTAVEVLMAMTMMAIGAAAVMSMQKAAVAGAADARTTDVANNVLRTWVERLQRDSMQWTAPSASNGVSNFALAKLLATHVNGQWFLPTDEMTGGIESMSPGFDALGRDMPKGDLSSAHFCVNVRLQWLVPQTVTEPGLIRADVRVLWPRGYINGPPVTGFCDDAHAQAVNPDPTGSPVYHSLYVTTTLKEHPAG